MDIMHDAGYPSIQFMVADGLLEPITAIKVTGQSQTVVIIFLYYPRLSVSGFCLFHININPSSVTYFSHRTGYKGGCEKY